MFSYVSVAYKAYYVWPLKCIIFISNIVKCVWATARYNTDGCKLLLFTSQISENIAEEQEIDVFIFQIIPQNHENVNDQPLYVYSWK